MNTIFTFKATKATDNKDAQYQVDLGVDILDGKTEQQINDAAVHTLVVNVQNYKGSLLRQSTSIEDAEKTLLAMGYDGAMVEIYTPTSTPKVLTADDIRKAIAKGTMKKADIEALLENMK